MGQTSHKTRGHKNILLDPTYSRRYDYQTMLKKLPLIVLFVTILPAHASIIQTTPTLPPTAGSYAVAGTICFPAACIQNITIGNFQSVTSLISGGDQLTSSIASLMALGFVNSGGSPGAPLGSVLLTGPMDITYFGRSSPTQLGTFASQITSLDFTGIFAGHTIEAMLNPAHASTGVTTVVELDDRKFRVDSFFDVFARLSIDGGPFVDGPVRHADLVPEPANFVPVFLGMAGFAALLKGRARRFSLPS